MTSSNLSNTTSNAPLDLGEKRTSITSNSHNKGDDNSESETTIDLWLVFGVIKRWWWLIVSIVAVVMGLTAAVVFRMTPIYKSTSVLEIKQQEIKIFNSSEVGNVIADMEFFNTQVELLQSTTLIENVIDREDMGTKLGVEYLPNEKQESKSARNVKSFSRRLSVVPVKRSRLIQISFEHENARIAKRVANAMIDSFIEYNLERKYNKTLYARDFIAQSLEATKVTLENSERELGKYAYDNDLLELANGGNEVILGYLEIQDLVALSSELSAARTQRVEREQKFRVAQSGDNIEIQDSGILGMLKSQRLKLNGEYLSNLATYKPSFPSMVELKSSIEYLDSQIETEVKKLKTIKLTEAKTSYEVALGIENDLQRRVDHLRKVAETNRAKSIDYTILEREASTNRAQYEALLLRLNEVTASDGIGSNLISIVDRAKESSHPVKPNKPLTLSLALVLGLLLGTGLVFCIEILDDKIKTPDDIKLKLKATVMGVVPIVKHSENMEAMLNDPQSSFSEAYASIRTNLQFSGPDGGPKIIHLTSTRSGEGKSVSSFGLALRYAGLNEKVLLIDADLRLPTFLIDHRKSSGLSGLLTSIESPGAHIAQTKFDNLYILPSGKLVPNPTEILATYKLDEILDYARNNFDRIIVDSPPVMGIADAPILAGVCDATLLIVECSSIRAPAVKSTLDRLKMSNAKTLGVILTKYKAQSKGYLDYYQYSYGESAGQYGTFRKGNKHKLARQKDRFNLD